MLKLRHHSRELLFERFLNRQPSELRLICASRLSCKGLDPVGAVAAANLKVFVHLAYGFGANTWPPRFKEGRIIGINEEFAYGYDRARALGCRVTYSHDHKEGLLGRLFRYMVRFLLGFDFVHAVRNRKSMSANDIVWTHTESQYLSVLLLTAWRRDRPKIIAQTIWLMDRWHSLPTWRQSFYKWLMKRADVLTFHSPNNLAKAKSLLPEKRSALVRFGIRNDRMTQRAPRTPEVVKLLAVGNDRDRDWPALLRAVGGWDRCHLKIVSTSLKSGDALQSDNVDICAVSNNSQLISMYEWADIALVVLRPNDHVSGLTAIQEAMVRGIPVIASQAGGLESYFENGEVHLIPNNESQTIKQAIEAIAADGDRQRAMTTKAQELMRTTLNSDRFVQEHVLLSKLAVASG